MHARLNKQERAEYKRLEVIASDATLSEAERELSRERIQRLRDAAVARAKLREIQGRDVTQSAAGKSSEEFEALNPAPLRSQFSSDEEYQEEHKWHQLLLDEIAAEGVLADPNASFSKRETAKRLLRKTYKAQHEMCPSISALDGSFLRDAGEDVLATPAPAPEAPAPVSAEDEFRYERYHPFSPKHKPGTTQYDDERKQWEATRDTLERWAYLGKLEKTDPEALAKEIARYQPPKDDDCDSGVQEPPEFIASPLQKQVWGEQSAKFAERRGETLATSSEPAVPSAPPPRRDIAYQLSLDGFTFFEDGEPCPIPLPSGIRTTGASVPPGYRSGFCQIPSDLRWDAIQFMWVQK